MKQAYQIGDKVEIIGPDRGDTPCPAGLLFRIFPASSLRLVRKFPAHCGLSQESTCVNVERCTHAPISGCHMYRSVKSELKVGDYVKVIGQPLGLENKPLGATLRILNITPEGNYDTTEYIYPFQSLRKLFPEEIEAHLHPIKISATLDCSKFAAGLEKCQDMIGKIGIEARLSAIEKAMRILTERQTESEKWQDQIAKAFQEAGA